MFSEQNRVSLVSFQRAPTLQHEVWCLEQGVLLPCRLGQVLVEVAEEARLPVWVGEVVDKDARFRVDLLPGIDQACGCIAEMPTFQSGLCRWSNSGAAAGSWAAAPNTL